MKELYERTSILLGQSTIDRLKKTEVLIAGIGGVGSYTAEALTRAGIGHITLIDSDVVAPSNLNRQLLALHSTIGRKKTIVMKERMLDINPDCQIKTIEQFITKETVHKVFDQSYDVVVDAIDILNPKLGLLSYAYRQGISVYSSLGAGNKLDPAKIKSGDLFRSDGCRLAKSIRKYLRREGITKGIQAVWSTESGRSPKEPESDEEYPRPINGTISTIPSLFGITLAGLVLKDLATMV